MAVLKDGEQERKDTCPAVTLLWTRAGTEPSHGGDEERAIPLSSRSEHINGPRKDTLLPRGLFLPHGKRSASLGYFPAPYVVVS